MFIGIGIFVEDWNLAGKRGCGEEILQLAGKSISWYVALLFAFHGDRRKWAAMFCAVDSSALPMRNWCQHGCIGFTFRIFVALEHRPTLLVILSAVHRRCLEKKLAVEHSMKTC